MSIDRLIESAALADPEPIEFLMILQLCWQAFFLINSNVVRSTPTNTLQELAPEWCWGVLLIGIAVIHVVAVLIGRKRLASWFCTYDLRRYSLLAAAMWFTFAGLAWGADVSISLRLGVYGLFALCGIWAFWRLTTRISRSKGVSDVGR